MTDARAVGRIVKVAGPVVDVEVPPDSLPEILNAIEVSFSLGGEDKMVIAEVAQHLGGSKVRAIALAPTDGMTRGSVESLAASVDAAEHSGTTVLGIGIGDATVEAAYTRHRVVAEPEALTQAMIGGVRSALRKSIAIAGGDTWWAHESALYDSPTPRSLIDV